MDRRSLLTFAAALTLPFVSPVSSAKDAVRLVVPFSATNYKNCSFVISGRHLKLQWIKGLKRLSFKPFFLSVEILQHAYKITKQNLL